MLMGSYWLRYRLLTVFNGVFLIPQLVVFQVYFVPHMFIIQGSLVNLFGFLVEPREHGLKKKGIYHM